MTPTMHQTIICVWTVVIQTTLVQCSPSDPPNFFPQMSNQITENEALQMGRMAAEDMGTLMASLPVNLGGQPNNIRTTNNLLYPTLPSYLRPRSTPTVNFLRSYEPTPATKPTPNLLTPQMSQVPAFYQAAAIPVLNRLTSSEPGFLCFQYDPNPVQYNANPFQMKNLPEPKNSKVFPRTVPLLPLPPPIPLLPIPPPLPLIPPMIPLTLTTARALQNLITQQARLQRALLFPGSTRMLLPPPRNVNLLRQSIKPRRSTLNMRPRNFRPVNNLNPLVFYS